MNDRWNIKTLKVKKYTKQNRKERSLRENSEKQKGNEWSLNETEDWNEWRRREKTTQEWMNAKKSKTMNKWTVKK